MPYDTEVPVPPPRPIAAKTVALDQLWLRLSLERRQGVLRTLSRVVAQQLEPPPEGKEVDDERAQRQGA